VDQVNSVTTNVTITDEYIKSSENKSEISDIYKALLIIVPLLCIGGLYVAHRYMNLLHFSILKNNLIVISVLGLIEIAFMELIGREPSGTNIEDIKGKFLTNLSKYGKTV